MSIRKSSNSGKGAKKAGKQATMPKCESQPYSGKDRQQGITVLQNYSITEAITAKKNET